MNNENTATATAAAVEVGTVKEFSELNPAVNFKEIAMPLVARGIPVIPVLPRKKETFLQGWQNRATTDPEQIEEWNNENPQYNCGAVAKLQGFWFFDCDVPNLPQTIEQETNQSFPQTFSVKSGKGLHFYFKHNAASQSLKKNIQLKDELDKVLCDVKVHNGYVVGPGSIHPTGTPYKVVNDAGIIEAPDWLVKWIKEQHKHTEAKEQGHGSSEGKIQEGGRDTFLFQQACKFRKAKMSKSDGLIALLSLNKEKCNPPMEDSVVKQKIESAYGYDSKPDETLHNLNGPSLTDFGNAERFVLAEGKNIRYCFQNKSWYAWDDSVWRKDESGQIYRLGKKTILAMRDEAAGLEGQEREILEGYERKCESEGRLNAMVNLARVETGIPIRFENFDTNSMLFNCSNASIDLKTGQPLKHCREDLISKISPVKYDPQSECPTWMNFLDTVTDHDVDLKNYLQRCAGYSFTGMTTEHAVFLLYGTGANGKSTFFEALRYVLGDYAQAAEFSTFLASSAQNVRNDLAKLNGARFVTAMESDCGKRLDETLVKQMTAGDTVVARFLYSEHFEYKPQFKLWLGTNHKPTIRGQDEGIWRRIRLIPFTVSIPIEDQDKNFIEKLKLEASGILNWALQGLADWLANGLQDPPIVKEATQEYRVDEDVLGSFLDMKCIREGEAAAGDLYRSYRDWAEHSGEFEMSQHKFSNALIERGFKKVRRNSGYIWKGISLIGSDKADPF